MDTIVFIDGQNLYRGAKDAWGARDECKLKLTDEAYKYTWPSYDVQKLATILTSKTLGRTLSQIRFYTGVPRADQNSFWHNFWVEKFRYLKAQGVEVYKGKVNDYGREKGVDVKLAIDLVRLTYEKKYEVALIVSQDRDLEPAIRLAGEIAKDQHWQIVFESHFPVGSGSVSDRGIPGTSWKPIDKTTYDACYDPQDYRISTIP